MEPNQPQTPQTDKQNGTPLYPTPTKGSLSDDHSSYGKQHFWKGTDPDKHVKAFFIGFIIFIGLLFVFAVQSWVGSGHFWF